MPPIVTIGGVFTDIQTFGSIQKPKPDSSKIVEWSNGEAVQFSDGQQLEW